MIKQFRSLHPLNIVLLIFVAFALHFPFWSRAEQQAPANFSQLYQHLLWVYPQQAPIDLTLQFYLGLIGLLAQAFILNKIINTHNLLGKASFMPALLFIVCGSFFESFSSFGPVQVCVFLMIWLLNSFLSMHRQTEVRPLVYNAGMLIAIGTIIYTPFVFFFPLIWVSLMIFRPFDAREWFIGLLGFLTIAFFLAFYYYWNDALALALSNWLPHASNRPMLSIDYRLLMPLALIVVLGFIQLRSNFFRSVVHLRKSYQLLIAFFVAAILSAWPGLGTALAHYLLAAAPVAVLAAYYFMHAGRRVIYETLFLLLLASVFYGKLAPAFNFF